jgi:hypothetical protein
LILIFKITDSFSGLQYTKVDAAAAIIKMADDTLYTSKKNAAI